MRKNDWVGLGVSTGLHVLVLLLIAMITAASPDPDRLGYIEVDFGPLAEGRPVQQAVQDRPDTSEQPPEPEPQEEPEPRTAPPEQARPVDLPDQPEELVEEERVQAPEAETIAPEEQVAEAEVEEPEPDPEPEPVQPLGGGDTAGTSGAASGDDGPGAEEEQAAPYQIEGLNRTALNAPLPYYAEKVNATIRVQIRVDPRGQVVGRIPLIKGNPALEQAVMDALQHWRFNPLPPNVPQDNQTGIVTFRFRLE